MSNDTTASRSRRWMRREVTARTQSACCRFVQAGQRWSGFDRSIEGNAGRCELEHSAIGAEVGCGGRRLMFGGRIGVVWQQAAAAAAVVWRHCFGPSLCACCMLVFEGSAVI